MNGGRAGTGLHGLLHGCREQVAGSRQQQQRVVALRCFKTIRLSRRSEDSGSSRRTRCPLSTIRSLDDPPSSSLPPPFHLAPVQRPSSLPLLLPVEGNETIYSGSDSSRVPTRGSTSFPSPAFFPEKRLVSSRLVSLFQARPFNAKRSHTSRYDSRCLLLFLFPRFFTWKKI